MPEAPQVIAEKGERIYKDKFQEEYERKYPGKFLAIDITSEQVFLADTPEEAIQEAQAVNRTGYFHLIKIGSSGVYRVGYTSGVYGDWIFGRQRRRVHRT